MTLETGQLRAALGFIVHVLPAQCVHLPVIDKHEEMISGVNGLIRSTAVVAVWPRFITSFQIESAYMSKLSLCSHTEGRQFSSNRI